MIEKTENRLDRDILGPNLRWRLAGHSRAAREPIPGQHYLPDIGDSYQARRQAELIPTP